MNITEIRLRIRHFLRKNGRIIAIIAVIWGIIILVNILLKNRNEVPVASTTYKPHVSVMDSAKTTPKSLQNPIEEKIKEFIDACNESNFQKAYNMLSDDCKKYSFNNQFDRFLAHIYNKMPTPKKYFIQNYSKVTYGKTDMYIYDVKYTDDFLATGLTNSTYKYTQEKYIFYKDEDGVLQMNIGNYLYHEDLNNLSENEYLKIDVKDKVVKYEVEEYTIKYTNRTDKTIVIADGEEADEIDLVLAQEVRNHQDGQNIVLLPGEEKELVITFPKFPDDGDISQSIRFSSVRIMDNYSGTENVDEEIIKQEIDNAIKISMEVKISK